MSLLLYCRFILCHSFYHKYFALIEEFSDFSWSTIRSQSWSLKPSFGDSVHRVNNLLRVRSPNLFISRVLMIFSLLKSLSMTAAESGNSINSLRSTRMLGKTSSMIASAFTSSHRRLVSHSSCLPDILCLIFLLILRYFVNSHVVLLEGLFYKTLQLLINPN